MRNNRGYTYLITNGRYYKIGITTNTPVKRVAELQTGSPTKITISGYSYNSNALAMEKSLHAKFSDKRLEGEWFALNDYDVAMIHHYFENNYLDEYFAPLSEKGLAVAKEKAKDGKVTNVLIKIAKVFAIIGEIGLVIVLTIASPKSINRNLKLLKSLNIRD